MSVIIPTHNRAGMVGEAIDSVLAQTFDRYEIIVVDDGSTDDTGQRLQTYGDRIRVVRTENGGVAHARNVGMRHARGCYLTFLDSDDTLYPYTLELMTQLLEQFPEAGFACAEMSAIDRTGLIERYHLKTYHRSAYRNPRLTYDAIFGSSARLRDVVALPPALVADDPSAPGRRVYCGNVFDTYLLNLVLCQNSAVIRRAVVEDVGERNVDVRHWQEVDYLLTITRKYKVCFADVPTYRLRYHPGQISSPADRDLHVWMRKQQILLRVVKRHAFADQAYYRRHRARIDSHLAHLHRAVAVPMLLQDGQRTGRRDWARYARRYLARAARYGRPAPVLGLASIVPAPLRSTAVKIVESCRELCRRAGELRVFGVSHQRPAVFTLP